MIPNGFPSPMDITVRRFRSGANAVETGLMDTMDPNNRMWSNFVADSRLRIENLRIMHRLTLSGPNVDLPIVTSSENVERKGIILLSLD